MAEAVEAVACSECFSDQGLRLDAEDVGAGDSTPCPRCGSVEGRKLSKDGLLELAFRFFVWGSLWRVDYGAAPLIQFNDKQRSSVEFPAWLQPDLVVFEELLGIGFFHYGPRLWMVGEIEPLKDLPDEEKRAETIERVLREYPVRTIGPETTLYRIRKGPKEPAEPCEYDSPPEGVTGAGRLDGPGSSMLYASPDLQVCVHECRVAAEDEIYVATLKPARELRLLDLSALIPEEATEFESLDMAIHMLFLAGPHSYPIAREIAAAARRSGFDGLVYPSYFSLLRNGVMPFQTVYGISHRRIPQYQPYEAATAVPNVAIFGRPVEAGTMVVKCINKLVLSRVAYEFRFGPVGF
jgi:hypothetical protein